MDRYLEQGKNLARLLAEYKRYGSLTIGFDFDDTVYDCYGNQLTYPLMRQLLRDLKSINCRLICWTANGDLGFVVEFLEKNNIPFDAVNEGGIPLPWETKKPFFSALLDDRAGLIQMYEELKELVTIVKAENERNSTNESQIST